MKDIDKSRFFTLSKVYSYCISRTKWYDYQEIIAQLKGDRIIYFN